ncbi:MAG: hypothetical protein V5789_14350 [Colwellia sp.]
MQTNKMFYWQLFHALTFTGLSAVALFSSIASAVTITAEMSSAVVAEYKQQLAAQTWPEMHTKLAFMDNPYKKFDRAIRIKLKAEAEPGQRKRLRTHEESILSAKKARFDHCQASVTFFVDFAKRTHTLTTVEQKPLSKETLMTGHGVVYPFTEAETNNGMTRPTQLALTLGWKYKGKGAEKAEEFLATCLALPTSLYYREGR